VLKIVTSLLCAVYVVAAAPWRPSLLPDASYGLLVHNSMQRGAPWNHVTEPNAENIALDRTYFYAVWSPGQYAVPGALIDAGLSVGRSAATVSLVFSLGGLLCWWWLFRLLGHDQAVSGVAVAVIAASRSFNQSFLTYIGSDVLAFAVFPLLVGILWQLRGSPWVPVFAAAAMVIAFTAKNSLAIYVGAWLVAQSVVMLRARGLSLESLAGAILPLAAAAATLALIHVGYNARGWTPASYQPAWATTATTYLLPWAMPILAATSWDDVLSRAFSHPSAPIVAFDYKASLALLAPLAGLSIAGVAAIAREGSETARAMAIFAFIAVAALSFLFVTGSGASLDLSRHYRIIGYLGLPWLVAVARGRRAAAVLVCAALALPAVYGLASFASNWRRHNQTSDSYSNAVQIVHPQMSPRVVAALTLLDSELPDSTLVVTSSADAALEFSRTRVLPTSTVSDSVERIRGHRRAGSVSNLVVIAELPGMPDEKRQAFLDTFTAYTEWQSIDIDNHRFYVPAGQTVSASWLRDCFRQLQNAS